MTCEILTRYKAQCASGGLEPDDVQEALVQRLDQLSATLNANSGRRPGWFRRKILGARSETPRGCYIYGGVGRGKSMLMDMFFDSLAFQERQRVHFHAFMQTVHREIHAQRTESGTHTGDLIGIVAGKVAAGAQVICFDEFHVTDIADAMILGRLFEKFFEAEIVVVATSNQRPRDLYPGGINRMLFVPFIDMIEERLDIVLLDSPVDYRMALLASTGVYHFPETSESRQALDRAFRQLIGEAVPTPEEIDVNGRILEIPVQARHVARFGFDDLCAKPLGSADYLKIASTYHTMIIDGIPVLKQTMRNEARRFMTLIDILYESGTGLLCSAATSPGELCQVESLEFEFQRTISRLTEMQSAEYLNLRRR